jgi:hypothetical protein
MCWGWKTAARRASESVLGWAEDQCRLKWYKAFVVRALGDHGFYNSIKYSKVVLRTMILN